MSNWNESMWVSFLAGAAAKSTAVLCGAWLLAFLLRSRSAAARHVLWTAACAALLALPFLAVSLPALRVPVGQTFLTPAVLFQTTATGVALALEPQALASTNAAKPIKAAPWRPDWRMFLILLWATGSVAAFIHMLLGWAALGRMRRTATPAGHPDATVLEALGIRHQVDIVQTARGSMPMIFGLFRPAVFMPADAAEWSPERRRVVLLHELAHVRRGDLATHLLARTALNLYWWNPLAWIAWREFLKERERAADDLVLNAGARPSEYAEHLLEIARTMQPRPGTAWASIAMARRSQLEGRMLSILDSDVNRNAPGRVSRFAAALLAIAIVAPLAAVHGQNKAAQLPADVDATIRSAESEKNFDVLDKTAKSAVALKQYDLARRLLDSALALRGQVAGPESLEYGTGLLHLGDVECKRGKREAAESFYAKAASVLGNHPEAARALMYLGSTAIGRKAFDEAIEDFQKAQMADPNQAPTATLMMAAARQRENKAEEADSLYKRAVAISDTNSETATALHLYAKFLILQGRDEEAKSAADRALAFRKPIPHARSAGVSRIGGGVSAPSVVYNVEPEYSEEARAAQLTGTVILNVEISPEGVIQGAWVVSGLGLGLDQKSIEAVEQWRFKPATKDGQPVPVAATIEVNWRLL